MKFCDIDQDIFGPSSSASSKKLRKLRKTTLTVDDDDEGEAIDDDETREWMDESSSSTAVGEESFGTVEDDADLDAPELEELLADAPVVNKGKGKATEDVFMATDSEEDVDEDVSWSW